MKNTLQQIFLAVLIGLGIPSLIFGVLAIAGHYEPKETAPMPETTAWAPPLPSYGQGSLEQ